MTIRDRLEQIKSLSSKFAYDRTGALQSAAELGVLVASLDGSALPDDGKAIAFATAALLAAGYSGMREFYFHEMVDEIRAALRSIGERA